jgi:tetratricopeptide (TPR) repeat protein
MPKIILILLPIAFIAYLVYKNIPILLFIKANKKNSAGKVDEAMKLYAKAYNFKHCKPSIKIMYTYVLIRNGEIDKAEKILDEVSKIKLTPKDEINIALNLSLIMWKKDDLQKAIELLEQLIGKGYKNSTIYQNLGYYLILNGEYTKALDVNKEACEYNDSDSALLDNLGINYYFLEDYEKAAEIYSKILPKNPSFASAYYYYAKTLKAQGNLEEALVMLNKGLSCNFSYISAINKDCIENEIKSINAALHN